MNKGLAAGPVAAAVAAGMLALTACASAQEEHDEAARAWVDERAGGADTSFPELRDVPREHDAITDPAHWSAVIAELAAARETLLAHPRAQAGPAPQDAGAFLDQARQDLERARDSD